MNVEDYQDAKRKVDRLRKEADRAEGALKVVMDELQTSFGVKDLADASKKLKELEAAEKAANEKFETELAAFVAKYGGSL